MGGGAGTVGAFLLGAERAHAHGLVQRANLPIPEWLFFLAAAVVLVVSFVALALLWSKPRLEQSAGARCPGGAWSAPSGRDPGRHARRRAARR